MDKTPNLTKKRMNEIIKLYGLEILPPATREDIRGALLAAYCQGIEAAESVGS